MGGKEYNGRRHLGLEKPLKLHRNKAYERIAYLLNQVADELKANEGVSSDEFKQPEPFPLHSSTPTMANQSNLLRSTNDKGETY